MRRLENDWLLNQLLSSRSRDGMVGTLPLFGGDFEVRLTGSQALVVAIEGRSDQ
jgi:hypothetical protein